MRLKPNPLITGLEMLGPVVTALTPGTFAMASIMLVDKFVVKYCLFTSEIDTGDFFSSIAFDEPVTTTSASSVVLSSNSKFMLAAPFTVITFEKVLNPNALICN